MQLLSRRIFCPHEGGHWKTPSSIPVHHVLADSHVLSRGPPPPPSRRSHLVLADSHLLSIESPKSAILISKELVSRMFSGCNHESRRESNKEDFFTGSSLLWDGRAGSHQSVGWGCRAEG